MSSDDWALALGRTPERVGRLVDALVVAGEYGDVGFRLASVIPEPGTALLLSLGLVGLAACRRVV